MAPRLFVGDEELGKRDDEYKPGKKTSIGLGGLWQQKRVQHGPPRRSIKRLGMLLLGIFAIYLFIHNIPTDLKPPRSRPSYTQNDPKKKGPSPPSAKSDAHKKPSVAGYSGTSKPTKQQEEVAHDFNGPIKFYDLAVSLHAVAGTRGGDLINRNVLFAAASLKSAATLLPIACEMAMQDRNYVHFALIGRDIIDMEVLKSVNSIGKECKIMYHDARADFSQQSSDYRMEVVTSAGYNHINNFVHPQATIIDGSGDEEPFMFKGLKLRALALGKTLIELPKDSEQNLMWLTRLDSTSLSAWNKASMDIVIHAQPAASGSLMRLLESLTKADYFSSPHPRLTIELPHNIDLPTKRYLESFRWPPGVKDGSPSLLTLHHRIPQYGLTAEENSIRFLESFWPAESAWNHVVVLAPHVELSPLFFHYLKYAMLEYKYSSTKSGLILSDNLLGISLDLPSTYLNDSTSFSPPTSNTSDPTPFLWQAPNSNAALYFGDKWAELHAFVAQSIAASHKSPIPPTLNEKLISKTYPSWLEHVLRLSRARGYLTLYPGVGSTDSLATLHNELYHAPEEYATDILTDEHSPNGELTADPEQHKSLFHKEAPLITKPLWTILPFRGDLPAFSSMPLIAWDGNVVDMAGMDESAGRYRREFRREVGGCDGNAEEPLKDGEGVRDLFCVGGEEKKGKVKEEGSKADDTKVGASKAVKESKESKESKDTKTTEDTTNTKEKKDTTNAPTSEKKKPGKGI
ncbi:hypothetical protein GLAREA_10542 [Glarea lozoyensis ATCC 20868]|uniref:Glycosyltransferase 2 n=1 Tax=Glarea lozoyensis (strain ATCC 20868 / MF5171) TaxID=1116229 RepID=S3D8R5_GLAL2|nr:uncharacterized protein GLAREA_10542 [Glarea lozoyensis ATCC 20868]EPE34847.1 hypothetical protein GLAREA_10542 [Glarea lozoyensis ATCC 20868]